MAVGDRRASEVVGPYRHRTGGMAGCRQDTTGRRLRVGRQQATLSSRDIRSSSGGTNSNSSGERAMTGGLVEAAAEGRWRTAGHRIWLGVQQATCSNRGRCLGDGRVLTGRREAERWQ